MSFRDDITLLAQKALYLESHSTTIEALKTALILPYFQALGYDIFTPDEFAPRFGTIDAKVDFATISNRIAHTLVVVEPFGTHLDPAYLSICFSAYKPKMALLTNGTEYRYYTDFDVPGTMDKNPFFAFNFANLSDSDISTLSKFQKTELRVAESPQFIQSTKYCLLVKKYLQQQFEFATDDFIRHILESVEPGQDFTAKFVDDIRPTIDKALQYTINDIITAKILNCLNEQPQSTPASPARFKGIQAISDKKKARALEIVKDILADMMPSEVINVENTQYYMSILCGRTKTHWICRLVLEEVKMYMVVHLKGSGARKTYIGTGVKCPISSVEAIYEYADLIKQATKQYIS